MNREIRDHWNVRKMCDGGWYWVEKRIIQSEVARTGFAAIAVYHVLASMADSKQRCFPSQSYVAGRLGCSRATVNRAVRKLEARKLIGIDRLPGGRLSYYLLGKTCSVGETEVSPAGNSPAASMNTNNIKITRFTNDRTWCSCGPKRWRASNQSPRTKEDLLALDLAEELGDAPNLSLYLRYAEEYPESLLRQICSEVKQLPREKVRKSRGALFTFLLKRYERGTR